MTVFFYAGNTYCHPGSCESSYPGSPEQFYSPNRIVSGSQVVKEIPAQWPVGRERVISAFCRGADSTQRGGGSPLESPSS